MQTQNRLFDDIARVASGALGALGGVRAEIEGLVRQQFERILADMNMVSREEFEVVQAMAAKARAEQEKLERRVAELEARLAARAGSAPAKPVSGAAKRAAKPAAGKAAAKPRTAPKTAPRG